MQLGGIHHLTAITADAVRNKQFYTEVLGLRLVKKTVNQDDTSVYHLFYADAQGSAGTDLTFFEWPLPPERRGTRSVSRTGLRVRSASLGYWQQRLRDTGHKAGEVVMLGGVESLDFEDHEGQRFRFVADDNSSGQPWDKSPVPAAHQILGLGPITIAVASLEATEAMLTQVMNMTRQRQYEDPDGDGTVHVFAMGEGGPAAELHVSVQPALPRSRQGAGGVHHVAFRVQHKEALTAWAERVAQLSVPNSGEIERFYFRSLYFREPGGVLFELATDGPGFDVDEPIETMGEALSLPPFLEPRRAQIEAGLKPLK